MYFLWMQSAKKEIEQKIDSKLAWEKLQNRIHSPNKNLKVVAKEQNIHIRTAKNLLKVAAVLFIGYIIGYFVDNYPSEPQYLSQKTLVDTINITLADHTSVKLNKNSKLTYPDKFQKKERKVKLKGEAFFKVKHNKKKPFIVETKIARIKVLGTEFNVKSLDTINKVLVTVQSGKVELTGIKKDSKKLILTKGETGIVDNETDEIYKEESTIKNDAALYWLNKKLIFKKTELHIVAQTLSNVFNVDIKLANNDIKSCRVDVQFENMGLDEILEVIAVTFDLKIKRNANQIIFDGNGCN
ncbi:MAG: hypothetical protein B6I20_12350 [Bacteroidetes bacterium 4572_117]|nr:MAG: hypothetical protein B6I20_12350 [Bacteroidetes bacterium 4572_117]